jgi:SRSO17 transposase
MQTMSTSGYTDQTLQETTQQDHEKNPSIFSGLGNRLINFCERFTEFFQLRTCNVTDRAQEYVCGLVQAEKKNMEGMEAVLPDADEQSLQHFLSNSPWDERPILDQVAKDVDALLGESPDRALLIDETSITKKGKHTVATARQWNGRLGKIDNCQTFVFASLNQGEYVTMVDERLYIPKEWIDDPERCDKAGIPLSERQLRTKAELALDMVRHQRELGVCFHWVGLDGGYGKDPAFLRALEDDGEVFVADVHKSQMIYLEDPQPSVPDALSGRGRRPTKLQANTPAIRVDQWVKNQPDSAWQRVDLRDSTKGVITVEVLHIRVWVWDGQEAEARLWHLLVRREVNNHKEIKYTLSNAPEETSTERLAWMQGQRYWVERGFQNGKSHVGLDHYQVRGWRGCHHHMALVMVTMLFFLEERRSTKETCPLLTFADIVDLLAVLLPRRDLSLEEVIKLIEKRHRKRQASIRNYYKKQQLE